MAKIIEFPRERISQRVSEAKIEVSPASPIPAQDKDSPEARMERIMGSLKKINKLMHELKEKQNDDSN